VRDWFPVRAREAVTAASREVWVLVAAGVVLVAVPTFFSVFVGATEWSPWVRAVILVVWILVALLVILGSVRQGLGVESLVGRVRVRRTEQRTLAANRLLTTLLRYGSGFPSHYEFRIFIYDPETDRLIPSYEPAASPGPSEGWPVGAGATGFAWENNEYVLVRGQAVSDGTYGLTKEQQKQYADLQVVAAMPVRNERNEVVAILSVSSETDDGKLASPEGQQKHQELAMVVGRVLIDLLADVE
jgi:hypothetical protein